MTNDERILLNQFLDQLVQVRGVSKDPEAEALINRALAQQPEGGYLLVQKALLQDQALKAAQAQIQSLQEQVQGGRGTSSGNFLGSNAWGNAPARESALDAPSAATPRRFGSGATAAQQPSPPPMASGSRMGSFLGTAAATAAGVAGGAFLFQGIESLLGMLGPHRSMLGGLGSTPGVDNVTTSESADEQDSDRDDDSTDDSTDDADYADDDGGDSGTFDV
jgi:hypothetical protein